jgi:F5/8 type C domain
MPAPTRLIYAYAFVFYTALACVLTYPLVWHLATVMPHDLGDPLLSTTLLWWNAHTVPFSSRWWDGVTFWPAPGSMAFSDHRLGESLIATPLQWLGASPVTAYNITLLAMFPLSALAAHWLGFVLTKRHDAAAIAGLSFGFCPYRISHLTHLELLAAFGMPAALAALHQYMDTHRRRWLVVFAVSLVLQGLCSTYYLIFFSILLGLWLPWFVRRDDARSLIAILIAEACALVALLPVVLGYSRIHAYYGLARTFHEILSLSADVTSYLTAHTTLLLWGWTARFAKPEGELFPGATIAVLALAGAILAWRQRTGARDRLDRLSLWLLPVAFLCAVVAVCGWAYAPWRIAFAGVQISSETPFKPMTLALLALVIWLGGSSQLRAAYARRSAFAFYAIATVILALCSLGPKPTLAGHQFLYEPPYAWLMWFPLFGSIRVPARLGLPVVLTLAMAGALAFNRLRFTAMTRRMLAVALMIGIMAEGWIKPLALPTVPDTWAPSHADGFAAVLELPLGDLLDDMAATYRVITHGHPVVNGSSGFEPTHYFTLRMALAEHDPAAFDGFPAGAPVLVVVDKRKDVAHEWERFLVARPRITVLDGDERWEFFSAAPPPPAAAVCLGEPVPIASASGSDRFVSLSALTDRNPRTWWATVHAQHKGDMLTLDLGRSMRPCAVIASVGEFRATYPRKLVVETSENGDEWNTVATERTAGLTMRAALNDPKTVPIAIGLAPSRARFVRLRLDESHPSVPWMVTDIAIRVEPAAP